MSLLLTVVCLLAACGQLAAELPSGTSVEWSSTAIGYDAEADLESASASDAGVIRVRGSGADIWDQRDEFFYVYTPVRNNALLTVRLRDFAAAHEWSKAGIMVRDGIAPDAPNALIHISGGNGSVFQARLSKGGNSTNSAGHDPSLPIGGWLRLARYGNDVVASVSRDGGSWSELGRYTLPLGPEALIGLAVTSHSPGALAVADFSNLELKTGRQVPPDPAGAPADQGDPPAAPSQPSPPGPAPSQPDPAPAPTGAWVCGAQPLSPRYSPTLYVSVSGNDANDGRSADRPFRTLQRAADVVAPGDVVWVRGGTYASDLSLKRSGTAALPIVFESYPGECAILDGSGQAAHQNVRFEGAGYNVFRNFIVRNNPAQGIQLVNASDNVVSNVRTHGNGLSGIQNLSGDRNRFSYFITHDNSDGSVGNADGIGLSSGRDLRIDHCVAYRNSDDGVDTWLSVNTVIERCISFQNGIQGGDGNGFKLGGRDQAVNTVIRYSIAFANVSEGFNYNSGRNVTLDQNTSYGNGIYGFIVANGRLRNNLAYGDSRREFEDDGGNQQQTNSWNRGVSNPAFQSTDPRNAAFLAPSASSGVKARGSDIGLPFTGTAPDLGAVPVGHTVASFLGIPLAEILNY